MTAVIGLGRFTHCYPCRDAAYDARETEIAAVYFVSNREGCCVLACINSKCFRGGSFKITDVAKLAVFNLHRRSRQTLVIRRVRKIASVCAHGIARLPLQGFSCNLIFECFLKICRENSNFY